MPQRKHNNKLLNETKGDLESRFGSKFDSI